jgi:hypothetical protein
MLITERKEFRMEKVICDHANQSTECLYGCEHVEPHVCVCCKDELSNGMCCHWDGEGFKVECVPIKKE